MKYIVLFFLVLCICCDSTAQTFPNNPCSDQHAFDISGNTNFFDTNPSCSEHIRCFGQLPFNHEVQTSTVLILISRKIQSNPDVWTAGTATGVIVAPQDPSSNDVYVLTSAHNFLNRQTGSGLTNDNPLTNTRFYFNYQIPFCPQGQLKPGWVDPVYYSQQGCEIVAFGRYFDTSHEDYNHVHSDWILLKLAQVPPAHFDICEASWRFEANGWAFGNEIEPTDGTCAFHTDGDVKKRIFIPENDIELGEDPPILNLEGKHVKFNANGNGYFHVGASGSPLFDKNYLLWGLISRMTAGNGSCARDVYCTPMSEIALEINRQYEAGNIALAPFYSETENFFPFDFKTAEWRCQDPPS